MERTSSIPFPNLPGEMAALTRAFDWSTTPLGPAEDWPAALRTILGVVLTSNHPMLVWWGPKLTQFYNDAYRQTLGPERHPSALGQPGRACWDEIWPIIGPQIESVLSGGPATWHEDQLVPVTRHGRRQDVWWTYGYSPIHDGEPIAGVLVVASDVTQQHIARDELTRVNASLLAESELRLHESERLKVMFQQAPGFMCILRGPQHVFEFANDAYQRLVGNRELIGKDVRSAVPEAEGQGFFEQLDAVFRTGQPFFANELPVMLQRAGEAMCEVILDFVYQPIIEADGSVSGIFVEGSDVTDKHQAQKQLRLSQERLQEGMVAARMLVWDWDLDTNRGVFSSNAREVFGTDLNVTQPPWDWLHPGDSRLMEQACQEAIARCGHFQVIVRATRPDTGESLWLDVRGRVVCGEDGQPHAIRGVALDVTDRKRAEEDLKEADRRKDEFLAMLAHELRNPLAPISSAAQLLRLAKGDPERARAASEIISRQVGHMTSLVDDLLDVARVSRGQAPLERKVVDLKQLLAEAIEQVRPLLEARRHCFGLRQAPDRVLVSGDRKRLVQVMANLLNNAAKYTPEGGDVQARLEVDDEDAILVVRDNGIGMAPELLPRVFDLFSQADRSIDRSQGGLGIGLSLVKAIVEQHGGKVHARSQGLGHGAEFCVALPRLAHVPAPEPGTVGKLAFSPSLRILVVDDNEDAAVSLSMCLQSVGHEVQVELSSTRALALVAGDGFDACLLDIGLPEMDGNELARRIRTLAGIRQPVLVAVTGYGQESCRRIAHEAGFDHYFVKPVATERLIELLGTLDTPGA